VSSPASDILTAVKAAIDDLSITDLTVAVRKHPLISADDPLPFCTVSPETEYLDDEATEETVLIVYPVHVRIAYPGNQLLETDVTTPLDTRYAVRQALHGAPLTGASTVIDVDIKPARPFEPSGYMAELDISDQFFLFLSQEDRVA
jgi:hypothetical protein